MKFKRNKTETPSKPASPTEGLFKGVFLAYGIVLLNVLLVLGVGLVVLFFRGVVNYMTWIFIAGLLAIFGTGYYFLHRMREEQRTLKEMLALPEFTGRSVEISLLGGFASMKMGERKEGMGPVAQEIPFASPHLQLEDPDSIRIRELTELGRMFEKDLITREEYQMAKDQIFRKHAPSAAIPPGTVVDVPHTSVQPEPEDAI